ncbi:helix-turn-helix transcriptional regulator [Sedimentibacter sp.]|uniref:helix-turn-helix transcriptional regulator n=1 Tax=Sedimentibacter sp. TaxID=1960295 RepID=UPI0028AB1CD0|nr:helix-turn-helix transcriptional regulator [Sedimentibacter sp.]
MSRIKRRGVIKVYKEFRKRHNLTQPQLAKKLEISQSVISDWETGKKDPNIHTLRKIYRVFGIEEIEFIMKGETKENIENP